MPADDEPLRADLEVLAQAARLPAFTSGSMADRVRRRRRRSVLGACVAIVFLMSGVAVLAGQFMSGSQGAESPMADPSGEPVSPIRPTQSLSSVYMCGDRLEPPDISPDRQGLSLTISAVRKITEGKGPETEVTFTADRPMHVITGPPEYLQVIYLKDGVIVGGGPWLNGPGDRTPQHSDLVRWGFEVSPSSPSVQAPGPRDRLCPLLTWPDVWSAPEEYEVLVLKGSLRNTSGQELVLGSPLPLGTPLLVARTGLPR